MALKEIITSPRWINAWVELLFAGVGTCFMLPMYGGKDEGAIKVHLLAPICCKNILADVVLLTHSRIQAAILTFLAFAYKTDFLVQSSG